MGFVDLSTAEIATAYNISVEQIFALGDGLKIVYKNQYTCLALEDAKAITSENFVYPIKSRYNR